MKRSEARILTTHTGSLPRPEGLVAMLGAVSRGEQVDEAALDAAAREATAGVFSAQVAAGVDVINNGEQSRISFSTYVTQRMSGFGGAWTRRGHRDQNEFPRLVRPRVVQLMRAYPPALARWRTSGWTWSSGNAGSCSTSLMLPTANRKNCS